MALALERCELRYVCPRWKIKGKPKKPRPSQSSLAQLGVYWVYWCLVRRMNKAQTTASPKGPIPGKLREWEPSTPTNLYACPRAPPAGVWLHTAVCVCVGGGSVGISVKGPTMPPVLGCSLQRSACHDGCSDVSVAIAGSRLLHIWYTSMKIFCKGRQKLTNKPAFCAGDVGDSGRVTESVFLHLPFNLLLPLERRDCIT